MRDIWERLARRICHDTVAARLTANIETPYPAPRGRVGHIPLSTDTLWAAHVNKNPRYGTGFPHKIVLARHARHDPQGFCQHVIRAQAISLDAHGVLGRAQGGDGTF